MMFVRSPPHVGRAPLRMMLFGHYQFACAHGPSSTKTRATGVGSRTGTVCGVPYVLRMWLARSVLATGCGARGYLQELSNWDPGPDITDSIHYQGIGAGTTLFVFEPIRPSRRIQSTKYFDRFSESAVGSSLHPSL